MASWCGAPSRPGRAEKGGTSPRYGRPIQPSPTSTVKTSCVLADELPGLGARDLVHLACCRRRDVTRIETHDCGLAAAMQG